MIRFEMELIPYGIQLHGSEDIARGSIWSSHDGRHEYWLTAGDKVIDGSIPKTKSGHQNPLHLLLNIMKDAEPQILALGLNYVTTRWDKS